MVRYQYREFCSSPVSTAFGEIGIFTRTSSTIHHLDLIFRTNWTMTANKALNLTRCCRAGRDWMPNEDCYVKDHRTHETAGMIVSGTATANQALHRNWLAFWFSKVTLQTRVSPTTRKPADLPAAGFRVFTIVTVGSIR